MALVVRPSLLVLFSRRARFVEFLCCFCVSSLCFTNISPAFFAIILTSRLASLSLCSLHLFTYLHRSRKFCISSSVYLARHISLLHRFHKSPPRIPIYISSCYIALTTSSPPHVSPPTLLSSHVSYPNLHLWLASALLLCTRLCILAIVLALLFLQSCNLVVDVLVVTRYHHYVLHTYYAFTVLLLTPTRSF